MQRQLLATLAIQPCRLSPLVARTFLLGALLAPDAVAIQVEVAT